MSCLQGLLNCLFQNEARGTSIPSGHRVWNGHVTHRSQGPSLRTGAEGEFCGNGGHRTLTASAPAPLASPPCLSLRSLAGPRSGGGGQRQDSWGVAHGGGWPMVGGGPWGLHRARRESSSSAVSTPGRFQERTSHLSPGPGKHSACWAERPPDEQCQRQALHL